MTTTAIALRTTESGSFLDRVVDHGVRHAMLTPARRHELARLVYEYHVPLFERMHLNTKATDDVLNGGRWMMQLLSLGLELETNGDANQAVAFLAHRSPILGIQKGLDRVMAIIHRSNAFRNNTIGRFMLIAWEREVTLSYVTDPKAIDHVLKSPDYDLEHFMRIIQNRADVLLFEQFLDRIEKELAVSKQFLPWDELRRAYGMKSLPREPAPDEPVQFSLHFDWGVGSLLGTIGVTLHTDRRTYGGVTIGWRAFERFIPQLGKPAFQQKTLAYAERYLHKKCPSATNDERQLILEMWRWALADIAENAPRARDVAAWTARAHLTFSGSRKPPDEAGVRMGTEASLEERSPDLLDIMRAGGEVSPTTIKKMLSALQWKEVRRIDIAELLDQVRPVDLISALPFDVKLIGWVVDEWEDWSEDDQRRLIGRLLDYAPKRFLDDVLATPLARTLVAFASSAQKTRLAHRFAKKH